MDTDVLYKIIIFWLIFFITPGPVWVAVMEATRQFNFVDLWRFFIRVFFPANVFIQVSQAIICVIFVKFISLYFSKIGLLLYVSSGLCMVYLAYKALKSKKSNQPFEINFLNLAVVMLLSPKIWLLFPSGAVMANQLGQSTTYNALIFAFCMWIISSLMFVLYVIIGKIGTKLLKDNFSYLTFGLLILFALFLFNEAVYIGFEK